MTVLVNFLVESSIILVFIYLVYHFLLESDSSYNLRRIFLLICAISSLTVPFININFSTGPTTNSDGLAHSIVLLPSFTLEFSGQSASSLFSLKWVNVLTTIYLFGIAVMLTMLLTRLFRLSQIIKRSILSSLDGRIKVVSNTYSNHTFSFFNYLVIHNQNALSSEETEKIIEHEKVHIRQGHSYDLIIMELLNCFMWFHPVSWIIKKKQQENHEYLADQSVVQKYDLREYRKLLAKMSLMNQIDGFVVGNYFSKHLTVKRLSQLESIEKTWSPSRTIISLALVVVVIVLFSCNTDVIQSESHDLYLIQTDIPAEAAEKLVSLNEEYPGVNFKYSEIDRGTDGQVPVKTLRGDYVRYFYSLTDKSKAGVITVTEEGIRRMAEMSKSQPDVYTLAERRPEPQSGFKSFYNHISQNLTYPVEARRAGIEGQVFIEFIVDKSGSLTDIKCIKGIGHGCDEAAVASIAASELWIPGMLDGENVKVKMVLPITFKLSNT